MPLAHILMPQLARKAQEIEDAIGPPRPLAGGYLQAGAPPTESDKALTELRAAPQRPDTVFKNAARQQVPKSIAKSKIKLIPNASSPARPAYPRARGGIQVAPDEPIGAYEDGRAIYAVEPAPKPAAKKKGQRTILKLPAGAAVGMNDRGEAVTPAGMNLGYLRNPDPNVRTLERSKRDIPLGAKEKQDSFGVGVLQKRFAPHLKAMQDNRTPDGMPTDKFPDGYFDGMTPRERQEIELGVARLRELENGIPI